MFKRVLILFTLILIQMSAYAGPFYATPITTTGGGSNTETENRAYAGLVWTLGEKASMTPDLSLGFRSLRVKSSNSVEGGDLSIRIKLDGGISFDSTRLSYVGGERDVMGNIGIGYSNTNSSLLGTAAVQGAYTRVGSDYEFANQKFVPYLEVLTADKPNKVNSGGAGSTTYDCSEYGPFAQYTGNTYEGEAICDLPQIDFQPN